MENQGEKGELLEKLEKNIDSLYFYLNMNFDNMTEEEKQFWFKLLENIDKNFYEDKDSDD